MTTSSPTLAQVPVLLTDDGLALYDSPVICDYLDSLHDGSRLVPAEGPERWRLLRLQALADGVGDAVVTTGSERNRPVGDQRGELLQALAVRINAGLDYVEENPAELDGALNLGQVALACALGYFDLRVRDNGWRDHRPKIAAWYSEFKQRPSMLETRYQPPGA